MDTVPEIGSVLVKAFNLFSCRGLPAVITFSLIQKVLDVLVHHGILKLRALCSGLKLI